MIIVSPIVYILSIIYSYVDMMLIHVIPCEIIRHFSINISHTFRKSSEYILRLP